MNDDFQLGVMLSVASLITVARTVWAQLWKTLWLCVIKEWHTEVMKLAETDSLTEITAEVEAFHLPGGKVASVYYLSEQMS